MSSIECRDRLQLLILHNKLSTLLLYKVGRVNTTACHVLFIRRINLHRLLIIYVIKITLPPSLDITLTGNPSRPTYPARKLPSLLVSPLLHNLKHKLFLLYYFVTLFLTRITLMSRQLYKYPS